MEDTVPPEVEAYLVGNMGDAGAMGGGASGQAGAASGGRSGGEWAAKRLGTTVERRELTGPEGIEGRLERVVDEYPKAQAVPPGDALARWVIPLGMTGLQKVVVEVAIGADQATVTAYGKEGKLNRKPTAKTAQGVAEALGG